MPMIQTLFFLKINKIKPEKIEGMKQNDALTNEHPKNNTKPRKGPKEKCLYKPN
jgi:hypothetical protein